MNSLRPPKRQVLRIEPRRRVLAIVGDTQVGLWVVRSLARSGLKVLAVTATPHGLAAHSRYASGVWTLDLSGGAEGFAQEVAHLARQVGAGSVMTIAEGFHQALIDHRHLLEPEIHLFSPPAEAFAKATDKDYMHALGERLGVPVARGGTLAELMARPESLGLRYPLVLRTRRQTAGRAVRTAPWKAAYAEEPAQLGKLYSQVRDLADNVLVQEYHPGAEDHVQILMHDGRAVMSGEYIGEHHMPLAGGVTVQRVSCRHEGLISDGVRLLKAVGWEGMAGAQFHYDLKTDKYIFLEINPRFIGGLPTVIMAGFDAPFLLWQSHFEPEKMRPGRYEVGLRTRILGGDANWMLGMIRGDPLPPGQRRLGKLSAMGRFLWNCMPWTKDDTFLLGDIKPALIDWKLMVKKLGSRTHDIIGSPVSQESPR